MSSERETRSECKACWKKILRKLRLLSFRWPIKLHITTDSKNPIFTAQLTSMALNCQLYSCLITRKNWLNSLFKWQQKCRVFCVVLVFCFASSNSPEFLVQKSQFIASSSFCDISLPFRFRIFLSLLISVDCSCVLLLVCTF